MGWNPASNDFTGYQVSFSTFGGAEVFAGVVMAPDTSFLIDDDLEADDRYTVYIRTQSGAGVSATLSEPTIINISTSKCFNLLIKH